VEAHSAGAGQGAEFRVILPLADSNANHATPETVSSTSHKSLRILLVEDNVDAADTLRDLLELYGHAVEVAYTGTSGVEAAQRLRPDVVLCDIGLPGMDGYQVAARLREDPALNRVRLVALTGYGQADDREKAHAAGFDLHLTKPVDPVLLEAILEEDEGRR
jgi:CheY-like chemotaxis protein